eukprot:scaffold664169_cov45-Prasinocladus_malaysianus.AAC.1
MKQAVRERTLAQFTSEPRGNTRHLLDGSIVLLKQNGRSLAVSAQVAQQFRRDVVDEIRMLIDI